MVTGVIHVAKNPFFEQHKIARTFCGARIRVKTGQLTARLLDARCGECKLEIRLLLEKGVKKLGLDHPTVQQFMKYHYGSAVPDKLGCLKGV